MTTQSLLLRIRNPKPVDVVTVSFSGAPRAVTAVARALASVVTVTEMRHHVQGDAVIRIDATCHRLPLLARRGGGIDG
jgi:hypothetical protein